MHDTPTQSTSHVLRCQLARGHLFHQVLMQASCTHMIFRDRHCNGLSHLPPDTVRLHPVADYYMPLRMISDKAVHPFRAADNSAILTMVFLLQSAQSSYPTASARIAPLAGTRLYSTLSGAGAHFWPCHLTTTLCCRTVCFIRVIVHVSLFYCGVMIALLYESV